MDTGTFKAPPSIQSLPPTPTPRYPEAKAAAKRLADLKTAQVERLRQELTSNQHKELGEVSAVYEEETRKFHNLWDGRVKNYQTALVMVRLLPTFLALSLQHLWHGGSADTCTYQHLQPTNKQSQLIYQGFDKLDSRCSLRHVLLRAGNPCTCLSPGCSVT